MYVYTYIYIYIHTCTHAHPNLLHLLHILHLLHPNIIPIPSPSVSMYVHVYIYIYMYVFRYAYWHIYYPNDIPNDIPIRCPLENWLIISNWYSKWYFNAINGDFPHDIWTAAEKALWHMFFVITCTCYINENVWLYRYWYINYMY